MTKRLTSLAAALLAIGCLALPATAPADGLRDVARKTMESKGDAIVTLEIVMNIKMSYNGQQREMERKQETPGLVIDERGLVVTSLASVDPGSVSARMSGEDDSMVSTVKAVKYILSDGSEVPAAVVFRDDDLDLAFLRPLTDPAKPMTAISVEKSPEAQPLEEAFSLIRRGKIARRTLTGASGEIQGVIKKPRTYYIPSSDLSESQGGTPVFNHDGDLLGMVFLYLFPGGSTSRGEDDQPYMFVVLPTSDIADAAKQAPAKASDVPTPAPEPEAPKEEEAAPAPKEEDGAPHRPVAPTEP